MKHTVKHRVSDEPAWINDLAIENSQRFAISSVQRVPINGLSLELVTIHALHVATVILIKAG